MEPLQGFILQPTYRIESGGPVVLLHGKLEGGGSFLIRDTRQVPHFYIRARDVELARTLGATVTVEDPPRVTMAGDPVARVDVRTPPDVPPLRDRLTARGLAVFEADIRFAYRTLMDRGIKGSVAIHGAPPAANAAGRTGPAAMPGAVLFENPELEPGTWQPSLDVLSLDIETDPHGRRLLSIALHGCGASEVLLLTPAGCSCPAPAQPFPDEPALLRAFVARVRQLDPDVLTGWNVIDFDLSVLARLAEEHGVALELGRGPGSLRLRPSLSPRSSRQAVIPGRLVLDGIDLVRGAYIRFESYALQAVAREVLGRGKTLTGTHRAEAILEAFRNDRDGFVEYNLNDAILVQDILERLHLVSLAVERSRLTGMPPDRVDASIASFDFLYLSELIRRRIVAPTVNVSGAEAMPSSGGHVMEPAPGLYRNVLVFDFRSLYPSIIRTFQIDPLGYHAVTLAGPVPGNTPAVATGGTPIVAPNGAAFSRAPGILPGILDELFPRRAAAIAAGDKVASQAIKILMNSFYGVLGTPACRFASPALANAITSFGRELLLWCRERLEARGHQVLYGDTDSLFVLPAAPAPDAPTAAEVTGADSEALTALGARLATELTADLSAHIQETWQVESRLELQFERLYLRLLLPELRHGHAGARKRYAGLIEGEDGPEVVFTGLEAVRSDWTELARQVQRRLHELLFQDRPLDAYLRQVVAEMRAGTHDTLLVYRKALRRDLDSYTSATPPHVAAARKLSRHPGRRIAYVITLDGPEPAAERRSPLDREHYVQKQVRAVAEPVLALVGLDFDQVVGDDAQLKLF